MPGVYPQYQNWAWRFYGREVKQGIFVPKVGKLCPDDKTSPKRLTLIDFAMAIYKNRFQH